MNKVTIIGVIIVVIIGIGVVSSISFTENTEEEVFTSEEKIILDEVIPIEESIEEEPEKTGKSITVELTETIGLKGP